MVRRARPAAEEEPLRADERALPFLQGRLHRHRLRARVLDVDLEVVLQVLADALEVVDDIDSERTQIPGVSDARELEELRRVDRAAAKDDLVRMNRLAVDVNANGFRPVEHDTIDERLAAHLEVRTAQDRMQVRTCGAQPAAAVDRPIELRKALLALSVHVARQLVARLLHGLEERAEERRRRRTSLEHDRPVATAVLVCSRETVLHPLEVGQAVRVVPVLETGLRRPALVVERVAALEDHPVDRARPAEDLAASVIHATAVHVRFGLGLVHPVVALVSDRERECGRHVDEYIPEVVHPPGFQHEHVGGRIRAQPVRQRAPGRATAHDDVVVRQESTTVCNSVKASIGAVPPTRPMPLAVPERPPKGRWLSQ